MDGPAVFSAKDVLGARQALVGLHEDIGRFVNRVGMEFAPESPAAREQAWGNTTEQLFTAYCQGHLLLESAADHVFALTRLLVEPIQTMAPWTCVRASLESAAVSCWLLGDAIGAQERIGRSLAFRYEGLSQQLKAARAAHDTDSVERIRCRINQVEEQALSLGYTTVRNNKGKTVGIAQRMPTATECVAEMLGREVEYRILSAMAHAHPWALIRLGFHAPNASTPTILRKSISSVGAASLLVWAADALARPVWSKASLFGHDLVLLAQLLENRYDQMGLTEKTRFWKCNTSSSASESEARDEM